MRFIAAIDTRFYGVAYSQGSEVNTVDWSRKQMLQFLDKGLIQASQITAGAIQDAIVFEGADVTTTVDASGRLVVHIETEAKELDWLTDVDTTGKVDDSVLAYDEGTGTWRPISLDLSGATVAFANLSDVDVSAAVNGSTIEFDALTGTWVAGPPLSSGTLAGLSDVDVTGIIDGQTVVWDNSEGKFVPGTPTGSPGPAGPVTWLAPVPWTSGLVATTGPPATVVTYNGSAYVCILSHTNVVPTNGTYWRLIVSKGDPGAQGDPGSPGSPGSPGPGVAAGGTTGQALKKASNTDYDTLWATLHELIPGGTTGQTLVKNSNTDYDVTWGAPASGYTDEQARDAIGAALVEGAGISIVVNDAGDTITIAADGTAGNVIYRGAWDIATTYAALDQVVSGNALWIATAASTGVVPSATRSYTSAGSDCAAALLQTGASSNAQYIHKFKVSADTLLGAVQFATVNNIGYLTSPVTWYLTTQIQTNGSTTDPSQLTPSKTEVPSQGGTTSNIYWNRLYLDDPITLTAGVEYALVFMSSPEYWNGGLALNPTPAYTGVMVAPTTTAEDLRRSGPGGAWTVESASRRVPVSILSTAAVSWERLATELDSTLVGRSILNAATAAAARAAIGIADSETYSYTGVVAAGVGVHRLYNDSGRARTITKARASVGTAPTGSSLVVDVNVNGTTAFSSKPTIAAGANTGSATPSAPTWADGAYLTVDVDSVGSTVAGSDLTVTVSWTE